MKSRVVLLFVGFVVLWTALIARSVYLQVLPNSKLGLLEKRQYSKKIQIESHRGAILDRNGQELAVTISTYSLFADPKIIENKKSVAKKVSKYLGGNWQSVYKKIKNGDRRFVWLKRYLSDKDKMNIQSWNIRGLAFIEEPKRIYPNEKLLSQVLGFVGRDGRGLEGIELEYNHLLKGKIKQVKVQRDALGRPLVVDARDFFENPDGAEISLTIDRELQFFLEGQLEEVTAEYEAESAVGVVLDAQTSEILAMGSTPRVDLNSPTDYPRGNRRNKAVTDYFEPGSTLKTIVAAGALREGLAMPNTVYDCEDGKLRIGRRIIREADQDHTFKKLTLTEILAKSSNVGITKVAFELGEKRTRKTLLDFGFGQKLGVDLPGEVSGVVHGLPWRKHQLSNISFGHAMTATALQVANAYAAIANGGELKTPFVVKTIKKPGEEEVQNSPQTQRRVLTKEQSEMMRLMLTTVTGEGGTGTTARVPGFPVAGKTGTAQKVNPDGRGYLKGHYISSFAGFVPANNPRYVIYIAVDDPKGSYYGSTVAAPVFSKVAQFAMRKSGMAPILISNESLTKEGKNFEFALNKNGDSNSSKVSSKNKSARVSAKNLIDMGLTPNILGMSLRQALKDLKNTDLKLKIKGHGRVVRTWPDPGDPLKSDRSLTVELKP